MGQFWDLDGLVFVLLVVRNLLVDLCTHCTAMAGAVLSLSQADPGPCCGLGQQPWLSQLQPLQRQKFQLLQCLKGGGNPLSSTEVAALAAAVQLSWSPPCCAGKVCL